MDSSFVGHDISTSPFCSWSSKEVGWLAFLSPLPSQSARALAHADVTDLSHPKSCISASHGRMGRSELQETMQLEAAELLIFSYVAWGKSLNFSQPHFANLSNGHDHFKHHGCSKAKQDGMQMLRSLWWPLTSKYGEALGKEVSIAQLPVHLGVIF